MIRLCIMVILLTSSLTTQAEILDQRMIDRIWHLVKEQTEAPSTLGMPPIMITKSMPSAARMMFQYPTSEYPDDLMMIKINPETVNNYSVNMLSWGIGHELTHYAMILEENNWQLNLPAYTQTQKHHCNRRFMRITRLIADLIYETYHDQREQYQMYDQVQRSCVDQPGQ